MRQGRATGSPGRLRALVIAAGVLVGALVSAPPGAKAQSAPTPPPIRQTVDPNGVDLVTGALSLSFPSEVSVGQPGTSGLSFSQSYNSQTGWALSYVGWIGISGTSYTVSLAGSSESFTGTSGSFTVSSNQGTGTTLSYDGSRYYTYTLRDGTQVKYDSNLANRAYYNNTNNEVSSITSPTGETLTIGYFTSSWQETPGYYVNVTRIQTVSSNLGYLLQFKYTVDGPSGSAFDLGGFYAATSVAAVNIANDLCSGGSPNCTWTNTWPTVSFDSAYGPTHITDPKSQTTSIVLNGSGVNGAGLVHSIQKPSGLTITYGYDTSNRVSSVSNGTGTWSYAYADNTPSSGQRTTTVTDPLSHTRSVISTLSGSTVNSDTDGLSRTTSYAYDSYGRVTRVTLPSGAYSQIAYDSYGLGNVVSVTKVSSTSGTPANIVTSATYDTSCTYPARCHKPLTITDADGNTTTYTYNTTTGQVATATSPTIGSVAPQTRYTYSSLYAWYKSGSSTYTQESTPVSMLTATSACQTTSSCSGAADEVKSTIGYTTGSSSVGTNLLPMSVASGAGDGSLTATTSTTYDIYGNVATVQGPLGSAQTTAYFYDVDREQVGVVGPDPDGTGSLLNRAVVTTYNSDGLVSEVQKGTESGGITTNPTSSGFTSLQEVTTAYDGLDRKIQDTVTAGGTTYAVTQYSYDNANRPQCAAVRMNPATYGSLPAPCTRTSSGSYGEDRITLTGYDAANEVTSVIDGYQTTTQRTVVTRSYTSDGLPYQLTDADGHVSTYAYDGQDRLVSLTYPDSSYLGYSYDDAHGHPANMVTLRQRDGQTIGYTYDALNRRTQKSGSGITTINYAYDNLSRMTSAASSSQTVSFTYDALSRKLTEAQSSLGTMTSAYDIAGRRTQLTWPGSFYVTYDYDELGEMTDVKESGSTTLASFSYDNLGRRTGVSRSNSVSTAYGYDGVSRLTSLAHSGSSNDVSFTYTYSPANQIVTRALANSAYAYSPTAISQAYAGNSLNQYTSVGGTAFGYDGRANLGSGPATYTYDGQNELQTVSGSPTVYTSYDPLDRLFQVQASSTTQFLYDGSQKVAEYASGSVLRRYVDGPGLDEPVVWYEGSGTSDRRLLLADERGSIIAVTNGSATVTTLNSYDEYGKPSSSNVGRFQYTGQAWIPEVALYDYKARMYLPSIGRFLQTDSAGYGAGPNLYAYANADPVNLDDPSGNDVAEVEVIGQRMVGPGRLSSNQGQDAGLITSHFGEIQYFTPSARAVDELALNPVKCEGTLVNPKDEQKNGGSAGSSSSQSGSDGTGANSQSAVATATAAGAQAGNDAYTLATDYNARVSGDAGVVEDVGRYGLGAGLVLAGSAEALGVIQDVKDGLPAAKAAVIHGFTFTGTVIGTVVGGTIGVAVGTIAGPPGEAVGGFVGATAGANAGHDTFKAVANAPFDAPVCQGQWVGQG